jgi:hypothetical protein
MRHANRRSGGRRPTRFALSLAVLASALASSTLLAGSSPGNVKGKVSGWEKLFPRVYADAAKDEGHRYTWREPSPTVKQDFRKLSANVGRDVCVAAFGSGAAQAHEPLQVKVTGGHSTPSTIVLSPGSRLAFKNFDPFPHQLYEVGNAAWAPNPTAPGSTREWAAGPAGVHEIRDQLFPSLVMYVVVDAQAVEYAFPDREGGFTMALPPGDYTLKAFFDGKVVSKAVDGVHVDTRGLELKEPIGLSGGDTK